MTQELQHVMWDAKDPDDLKSICGKTNDLKADVTTPVCPECFLGTLGDFGYVYSILRQFHSVASNIIAHNAKYLYEKGETGDILRQLALSADAIAACMEAKERREDGPKEHPIEAVNNVILAVHNRALLHASE